MKWLVLPGLALLSGNAFAQDVTPRSVATAYGLDYSHTATNIGRQDTLPRFFGEYDGGDTPTTRLQREQRACMAFATFPELQAELATLPPGEAQATLLAAEKKARWLRIRAREAAD